MAERTGTLYQQIKSNLEKRNGKDLNLAGKTVNYDVSRKRFSTYQDREIVFGDLTENVNFFVSPRKEIGFDWRELDDFSRSLEITGEQSLSAGSGWVWKSLSGGGEISIFHLGVLFYSESLTEEDLLDPRAYYRKRKELSDFDLKDGRNIWIRVYPSQVHADQIYSYQEGLTRGKKPDPLLDWLTRSVTQEQIDCIKQAGPLIDFQKLPPPPQLSNKAER